MSSAVSVMVVVVVVVAGTVEVGTVEEDEWVVASLVMDPSFDGLGCSGFSSSSSQSSHLLGVGGAAAVAVAAVAAVVDCVAVVVPGSTGSVVSNAAWVAFFAVVFSAVLLVVALVLLGEVGAGDLGVGAIGAGNSVLSCNINSPSVAGSGGLGTPFSSYLAGLQMPAPMPKLSCFDSCHTHVRGTRSDLVKHLFWRVLYIERRPRPL
jgi:hypothetical protein